MKRFQQTSDSELEIMRIIWNNNNSALLADIMEALNKSDREWKQNTVLTFLARLIDKGVISTIKHGRINEYIAVMTLEDYLAEQTRSFLNKVYGGNARDLISSLLKQDYIDSNDMDELKRYWEDRDNE